jgi:hypothetical protein
LVPPVADTRYRRRVVRVLVTGMGELADVVEQLIIATP